MNYLPTEIIELISSFQDNVSDVSKLRRSCKRFMNLKLTPRSKDNLLLILLKLYPNRHGDFLATYSSYLNLEIMDMIPSLKTSANLNRIIDQLDWEFIKNNPQYEWDWDCISSASWLTWEIIKDGINYNGDKYKIFKLRCKWNKYKISKHPNITWEIIRNNLDFEWDRRGVSCNPNITFDIIKNNPEFGWDRRGVSCNPNITLEIVKLHPEYDFDCQYISEFDDLSWEYVLENIERNWNWSYISYNMVFTEQTLKTDIMNYVDYYALGRNESITLDMVKNNPHLPWEWLSFAENPNFIEYVLEFEDASKLMIPICMNNGLTWNLIQKYKDKLNWSSQIRLISSHPNITFDIIINNPDFGWNTDSVSDNPNITWKIVKDNPDYPWVMYKLIHRL